MDNVITANKAIMIVKDAGQKPTRLLAVLKDLGYKATGRNVPEVQQ